MKWKHLTVVSTSLIIMVCFNSCDVMFSYLGIRRWKQRLLPLKLQSKKTREFHREQQSLFSQKEEF